MQIMLLHALVFHSMALHRRKKIINIHGMVLWLVILRSEVIDAPPASDKILYLVNIFPHSQKELPKDM
jgi:hypothetical protein